MVRTMLLNQDEFRFKVGLAQFFAGLFIMVLALEQVRSDVDMWNECAILSQEPEIKKVLDVKKAKFPDTNTFIKVYVRVGFKNLFTNITDNWVLAYVLLYCLTQICIQRLIEKIMLMSSPKQRTVSYVFGSMVAITASAFAMAGLALPVSWHDVINLPQF